MTTTADFAPKPSRAEEAARVNPDFPDRPTPSQISKEYTPERVLRLCRFVAARVTRGKATKDEFDEAVQDASLSFYKRVAQYNRGTIEVPASYPFYYWLLFRMMTDVREIRYRETRRLNGRKMESLSRVGAAEKHVAPEPPSMLDKLAVEEAMEALTDHQRAAVRMYYFEFMTQTDIARKLGIAQKNVHGLLKRAREKMKLQMVSEEDE